MTTQFTVSLGISEYTPLHQVDINNLDSNDKTKSTLKSILSKISLKHVAIDRNPYLVIPLPLDTKNSTLQKCVPSLRQIVNTLDLRNHNMCAKLVMYNAHTAPRRQRVRRQSADLSTTDLRKELVETLKHNMQEQIQKERLVSNEHFIDGLKSFDSNLPELIKQLQYSQVTARTGDNGTAVAAGAINNVGSSNNPTNTSTVPFLSDKSNFYGFQGSNSTQFISGQMTFNRVIVKAYNEIVDNGQTLADALQGMKVNLSKVDYFALNLRLLKKLNDGAAFGAVKDENKLIETQKDIVNNLQQCESMQLRTDEFERAMHLASTLEQLDRQEEDSKKLADLHKMMQGIVNILPKVLAKEEEDSLATMNTIPTATTCSPRATGPSASNSSEVQLSASRSPLLSNTQLVVRPDIGPICQASAMETGDIHDNKVHIDILSNINSQVDVTATDQAIASIISPPPDPRRVKVEEKMDTTA